MLVMLCASFAALTRRDMFRCARGFDCALSTGARAMYAVHSTILVCVCSIGSSNRARVCRSLWVCVKSYQIWWTMVVFGRWWWWWTTWGAIVRYGPWHRHRHHRFTRESCRGSRRPCACVSVWLRGILAHRAWASVCLNLDDTRTRTRADRLLPGK